MSDDWKKNVDAHFAEQQRQEEERKPREQEAREAGWRERDRKKAEEEAKNLAKLANRFHCHICGTSSKKPAQYQSYQQGGGEWGTGGGYYDSGPNWHEPGDLTKCSKCKQWTCNEHIYNGFCQRCAEKL